MCVTPMLTFLGCQLSIHVRRQQAVGMVVVVVVALCLCQLDLAQPLDHAAAYVSCGQCRGVHGLGNRQHIECQITEPFACEAAFGVLSSAKGLSIRSTKFSIANNKTLQSAHSHCAGTQLMCPVSSLQVKNGSCVHQLCIQNTQVTTICTRACSKTKMMVI